MSKIFEDFFDDIELDDIKDNLSVDSEDWDVKLSITPGSPHKLSYNTIYNIYKSRTAYYLENYKHISKISEICIYKDGHSEKLYPIDTDKKIDNFYWNIEVSIKFNKELSCKQIFDFLCFMQKFKYFTTQKTLTLSVKRDEAMNIDSLNCDSDTREYMRNEDLYSVFSIERINNIKNLDNSNFTPNTADIWIRDLYRTIKVFNPKVTVFEYLDLFNNINLHFDGDLLDNKQQSWYIENIGEFILDINKDDITPTMTIYISNEESNKAYSFYLVDNKIEMDDYFSHNRDVPFSDTIANEVVNWLVEKPRQMRMMKFTNKNDKNMTIFGAVAKDICVLDKTDTLIWITSTCKDKNHPTEPKRLIDLSKVSGINLIDYCN